jgi:hypothetical protein
MARLAIIAPESVEYISDPTFYTVTVEGDLPKGGGRRQVTENSLWIRQDVYDNADADVDLAQYAHVVDRTATLSLGVTPSWPDIPGGGGRIELVLWAFNGYGDKQLDTATMTLLP